MEFPAGSAGLAFAESDMGCLGGALLMDNTAPGKDDYWIFRNHLPKGCHHRLAYNSTADYSQQLISPSCVYYPPAYSVPRQAANIPQLSDDIYLPSALLKEFSECTDEEMDCALSGSAMQAIPTTNNAAVLILQADRDNLRIHCDNEVTGQFHRDKWAPHKLPLPIKEINVKQSAKVEPLIAIRTLGAIHLAYLSVDDENDKPLNWQLEWRPNAQPLSMDFSQFIASDMLILDRRSVLQLVDIEQARQSHSIDCSGTEATSSYHSCLFGQHPRQCLVESFDRLQSVDFRISPTAATSCTVYQSKINERLFAMCKSEEYSGYHLGVVSNRHVMLFDARYPNGRPSIQWPQSVSIANSSGASCRLLRYQSTDYLMQFVTGARHESSALLYPFFSGSNNSFPPSAECLPLSIEPLYNTSNVFEISSYGLLPKRCNFTNDLVDITPPIVDVALATIDTAGSALNMNFYWHLADGSLHRSRCALKRDQLEADSEFPLKSVRKYHPAVQLLPSPSSPSDTLSYVQVDLTRLLKTIKASPAANEVGELDESIGEEISVDALTKLIVGDQCADEFRRLITGDAVFAHQLKHIRNQPTRPIKCGDLSELAISLKERWLKQEEEDNDDDEQVSVTETRNDWHLLSDVFPFSQSQPMITQSQPVFAVSSSSQLITSSSSQQQHWSASQIQEPVFSASQPAPTSKSKKRKSGFR